MTDSERLEEPRPDRLPQIRQRLSEASQDDWEATVAGARIFNAYVAELADTMYLEGGVFLWQAPDRAKEFLWQQLESHR